MIPSTIGVKYDTVTTVVVQDSLKMFVGEEVLKLLLDENFQASWDDLYARCPWATVFQSRPFVATWYQVYQNEYLPITITYELQGKLKGLLTIAKDKSGLISGAGKNHAEYQVWLSTETDSGHFITGALLEVKKRFPESGIQFKYMPGNVSLAWLETHKVWRRRCLVEVVKQPLLRINDVSLTNELKKKSNRYKINRLKKIGGLRFERITDGQIFASVFDELALQYDFRKSAMYNITFFRNGMLAKQFFLSLFEKNLLHATVLKLKDEIIASTIGTIGRTKCMHFTGINTHSFFYAKSSPGSLQLLMLSKLLAEEGIEVFDLTPGTDHYKEILANDHTIAYKLTVGIAYKQLIKKMGFTLIDISKKSAAALGIKRSFLKKIKWKFFLLKNKITPVLKQGFSVLNNGAFKLLQKNKKYCIAVTALDFHSSDLIDIQKDSLSDLMKFEETSTKPTRWQFHAEAMRRFEEGEHCFSWADDNQLLYCVWFRSSMPADSKQKKSDMPPEKCVLLYEIYCHPAGIGMLPVFLKAAAFKTAAECSGQQVYALATNNTFSRALETSGFWAA